METKYRIWTKKGITTDWLPYEQIILLKGPDVVFYEASITKPLIDQDLVFIQESDTGLYLSLDTILGYDRKEEQYFAYQAGTVTTLTECGARKLLQRAHHAKMRIYLKEGIGSLETYLTSQQ